MIQIYDVNTVDADWWKTVITGVRLSHDSVDKSDTPEPSMFSKFSDGNSINCDPRGIEYIIGKADKKLLTSLSKAGSSHRKFMRQIPVLITIDAPLYWWKEFDTYKVATCANSESTMHTITKHPFELSQFSCDQMNDVAIAGLEDTIDVLNQLRHRWKETDDEVYKKGLWYSIIQLLPSSWNQKRLVSLNYEVLYNIYHQRKNHKLAEWREFCEFIERLPLAEELIAEMEYEE